MEVATKFVDELVEIGALKEALKGKTVLCNDLLLIMPKVRQCGQWHILSDMKRGDQNTFIASDPVALPCPQDILAYLYDGGYMAVIAISKIYPVGAASLPGITSRKMAGIIRIIKHNPLSKGGVLITFIIEQLRKAVYDPGRLEGRLIEGPDGF
eukprot:8724492-Ditylum_brightwellii.AAC.1